MVFQPYGGECQPLPGAHLLASQAIARVPAVLMAFPTSSFLCRSYDLQMETEKEPSSCPQALSLLSKPFVALEPFRVPSGTQALPRESADVGSRWWGRGWQRPPSLLGQQPQEDSTSHHLPSQVWEQLPAYPCQGATAHHTSAPSGDSAEIPATMGACEFPWGLCGVWNNTLLKKAQSAHPS